MFTLPFIRSLIPSPSSFLAKCRVWVLSTPVSHRQVMGSNPDGGFYVFFYQSIRIPVFRITTDHNRFFHILLPWHSTFHNVRSWKSVIKQRTNFRSFISRLYFLSCSINVFLLFTLSFLRHFFFVFDTWFPSAFFIFLLPLHEARHTHKHLLPSGHWNPDQCLKRSPTGVWPV